MAIRSLVAVAAVLVAAAGCADDSSDAGSTTTTPSATSSASTTLDPAAVDRGGSFAGIAGTVISYDRATKAGVLRRNDTGGTLPFDGSLVAEDWTHVLGAGTYVHFSVRDGASGPEAYRISIDRYNPGM